MNIAEARASLRDANNTERRLAGARYMATRAGAADLELLRDQLVVEEIPWIRRALRDGVQRLESALVPTPEPLSLPDVPADIYELIYARALEEVTHQVVHEVRTIVGTADYYAGNLVADYESTRAFAEFDRLRDALRSVSLLGEAASTPTFRQFDLAEVITEVAREERKPLGVAAQYRGPQPCLVTSDRGLVEMVLRNAIRNACEATAALCERTNTPIDDRPITVSWQHGDGEYIVFVLDEGPGLPASRSRAWDIGVTTKRGHSGVGLPTAKQAARSLDGFVELNPSNRGGAVFEFRFPALEGGAR